MLIDFKTKYYAIIEYYDDDDWNKDQKWLYFAHTFADYINFVESIREEQPHTGAVISHVYFRDPK